MSKTPELKILLKACDTFGRACRIIDALPPGHERMNSDLLRNVLPGIWPTVGDLRKLRKAMEDAGWDPNART